LIITGVIACLMRLIGVEIIYNLTMKMASSDIGLLALVLYLIFGLKDLGLFIAQIYVVILIIAILLNIFVLVFEEIQDT